MTEFLAVAAGRFPLEQIVDFNDDIANILVALNVKAFWPSRHSPKRGGSEADSRMQALSKKPSASHAPRSICTIIVLRSTRAGPAHGLRTDLLTTST
ncbi:hypothetical protein [Aliihoeflea sp. 40Bstr573]|uniref:hypothetical protein n=1 Tax=Aliihoeflea sp. 40Bstr573 TaxID=2696467 RepID=UPI00209576EE|nr:hypothetical protein [Aliihoeflea sp. 40Bstr573]MCO6388798.1 hypothetical protein [Aliihoeflea sp. 40Bstr573]